MTQGIIKERELKGITEEQMKTLADEYKAEYAPMYQKVAGIAFIDGFYAAMKFMSDRLKEL